MKLPSINYASAASQAGVKDAKAGVFRPDLFRDAVQQHEYEFGWTYGGWMERQLRASGMAARIEIRDCLKDCWWDDGWDWKKRLIEYEMSQR